MSKRMARWLAGAALALAIGFGLTLGGRPAVVHAGDPTPTPITNGVPGGGTGGGH